MTAERVVHIVVPDSIDDAARTSGGNVFDRRIADGLAASGWDVRMLRAKVAGGLDAQLAPLPEGAVVLIDGLVARAQPAAIEQAARRLSVAVLAHMVTAAFPDAEPGEIEGEWRALRAAHRVIATSAWTRRQLRRRGGIPAEKIAVAVPGTVAGPAAPGTAAGGSLLCVGVVAPHKGQDVLAAALQGIDRSVPWTCTMAGSLDAHPAFARRVRAHVEHAGRADGVRMPGVLHPRALDDEYGRTDLLVAPSRVESSGMAIADALRRGIPVVASDVGGIPLTVAPSGAAMLVAPGRPAELREVLQRWMTHRQLRERLKNDALRGRHAMPAWEGTVARIAAVLEDLR